MKGAAETLGVWMHGQKVAVLIRQRGRLSLHYTPDTIERYELNVPLLSVSLPLLPGPFKHDRVHPFFEGLLPEGMARQAIAYDRQLDPRDTFGLLAALGRDCAGAVVIVPEGEIPPQPTAATLVPLTDAELGARLQRLPTDPLGVDERVRISLAGVQNKLVLSQLPSGQWALPIDGLPSMHILKRANRQLEHMVANEAFCLAIGRRMGIPVAEAAILHLDEPYLVVTRFDRIRHADGSISRIHQEDLAQALSLDPGDKYEEKTGPTLLSVARCIREQAGGLADLAHLLAITLLNVVVGNADAHVKNVSLLHHSPDHLRLAPAYDILSTAYYPQTDTHPAMFINGKRSIHEVTIPDLIQEAAAWGLDRGTASDILSGLLDTVGPAIRAATQDVPEVPDDLVNLVTARASRLCDSLA